MNSAALAALDHAHVWHPFTAMRQWRQSDPLVIESAEGFELIDTEGRRYIDGVSSLWCNVHGHQVPEIDAAIRGQLEKVAHTTMLGLASPPSIELAGALVKRANPKGRSDGLNKVFYSDAGATAVEVAFKMAVGYWYHVGKPEKTEFIGVSGAYHGDTNAAMSVGYSDLFHRPFKSMVFPTRWLPSPDPCRPPVGVAEHEEMARPNEACLSCRGRGDLCEHVWPSECPLRAMALRDYLLNELENMLKNHGETTAAIVVEPVMQGAAGMIGQPIGLLRGMGELAKKYDVLLVADEVATGFGRTGPMFAYQQELGGEFTGPDLLCLAKGITGGYLPLAATLATDKIEEAFCGDEDTYRAKTFYHGHTYTGNPLACAAAIASLKRFDDARILEHAGVSAKIIAGHLIRLRSHRHVRDIRQRGLMVGIELCADRKSPEAFDFSKRTAAAICLAMREKGLLLRPLGDVLVLMPAPAMPHDTLERMLQVVVETLESWVF